MYIKGKERWTTLKKQVAKEEKKKKKEHKVIEKFVKKKDNSKQKYITKGVLKRKFKNAQSFTNAEVVNDNGIIKLRDNSFARVFSVDAIDLSLTSNNQKQNFFNQLKFLYQLKGLNLRIYKLDDKIDLNANKDYYNRLMEEFANDEEKLTFLKERYDRLEILEEQNLTTTSRYYFVLISDNDKALEHTSEELEMHCYNMTPRLHIQMITNKLEIYQFLINLYLSNANIEQLMWSDLVELITPFFINETVGYIKSDDTEIQVVTIKRLPPFIDELFFEELFNVPDTRCCIHIKDTIPTEELVRRLDSNYEFLVSERSTTRKLSDATQMDTERENFQALMTQIKNGDEKIKEVDFIIVISGNRKQREEKLKELHSYIEELKVIKRELVGEDNKGYIKVRRYNLLLNNNITIVRDKIIKGNSNGSAVVTLPVTKDREVLLVVQPRVVREGVLVELPAGYIEDKENPIESIKRELLEETGYTSNNIKHLSSYYQDQGCSDAYNHTYLALDCEKIKEQNLDKDEFIRYFLCDYSEALELVDMGYIKDIQSKYTLELSKQYIKR